MSEVLFPTITKMIDGHMQSCNLVSNDLSTKRTLFLSGEINDLTALTIITQIRYLVQRSSEDSIVLCINSNGGSLSAGLAILDYIQAIPTPVITVALGNAYSMAAILLACCGSVGNRYASPNTSIMIHQPSTIGSQAMQATDVCIQAAHIQEQKERIVHLLALCTGRTEQTIAEAMERDFFMNAESALDFGLIDYIGLPKFWVDNT